MAQPLLAVWFLPSCVAPSQRILPQNPHSEESLCHLTQTHDVACELATRCQMSRMDGIASSSFPKTRAVTSSVRSPGHSRSRAWPSPSPLPMRSVDRENDGQNRSDRMCLAHDVAIRPSRSRQSRAERKSDRGRRAPGTIRPPPFSPGGRACLRRVPRLRPLSKWSDGRSRGHLRAKGNPLHD